MQPRRLTVNKTANWEKRLTLAFRTIANVEREQKSHISTAKGGDLTALQESTALTKTARLAADDARENAVTLAKREVRKAEGRAVR